MKVLILQVVTPEIEEYAQYTALINLAYAYTHGYDYKVYSNVDTSRHPSWSKVKAAMESLADYDRVFVVDADAYIQNFDIKVESFTGKPLKFCRNGENGGKLLNAGLFMVDNLPGPEITQLLQRWWEHYTGTEPFWEQDAINDLYIKQREFKEAIEMFPMRAFNSWWQDVTKVKDPAQFVMHVMARETSVKARIIEAEYERLKPMYPNFQSKMYNDAASYLSPVR